MLAYKWKCKLCGYVMGYGVKQEAPSHCKKCGQRKMISADRPKISQMVIDEFSNIIDAQDQKGIEKYGRSIDDAIDEDYDWRIMALEESADQLKYLTREVKRLEKQLRKEKQKNIHLEKLHLRNINFEDVEG